MNSKIGVWEIGSSKRSGPRRLVEQEIDFERDLEDWICNDPGLIGSGLVIIGRQVSVESGTIDLLAIDPLGRIAIIEIKRSSIDRKTLVQALDYAESIARMDGDLLIEKCANYLKNASTTLPNLLRDRNATHQVDVDQREVILYLVGTGGAPRLERLAAFLNKTITSYIVLFDVFRQSAGKTILARELHEIGQEDTSPNQEERGLVELCRQAKALGVGKEFQMLCDAALNLGLYANIRRTRDSRRASSVMFAPSQMKSRMAFTFWIKRKNGTHRVWLDPEVFSEYFPVSTRAARQILSIEGDNYLGKKAIAKLAASINRLAKAVAKKY